MADSRRLVISYREGLFTTVDDGITFSSTEQYYQYQKALHYNCQSAATNILCETDPVIIKHIGGSCKGKNDWDKVAQVVMEQGIYAKFSSNAELVEELADTAAKNFVECVAHDNFWGAGLSLQEAMRQTDELHFTGQNVLGTILDTIRDKIIDQ